MLERTYRMRVADAVEPFPVRWFRPVCNGEAWVCDYEIAWPEKPAVRRGIFGVDAVQALQLAMNIVAVELYTADPAVFWWEPDDVLGLPVPPAVADLEAARTRGWPEALGIPPRPLDRDGDAS